MHAAQTFVITFTVAGEMACGQSAAARQDWRQLCRPYPVLPWSLAVSWRYGEIFRELQRQGTLVGTNDLWIAATVRVHGMGVVTNNADEFRRIDGRTVLSY